MTPENRSFFATRIVIMVACLIVTGLLAFAVWQHQQRHSADVFNAIVSKNLEALKSRLQDVEIALDGAGGLVGSSDSLSERDWLDYVATIQIERRLPRIGGIGWIAAVNRRDGSLARVRQGLRERGFSIHPPATSDDVMVIEYYAPDSRNASIIGLNVGEAARRRDTLERTVERRATTLSNPSRLIHFNNTATGFIMLRPFFAGASGGAATALSPVEGFAYAPMRAQDLFAQISFEQGHEFELAVYSGQDRSPGNLIFASADIRTAPQFDTIRTVQLYGMDFTLRWQSTVEFEKRHHSMLPVALAGIGAVFIALIGFGTLTQTRRTRAIEREVRDQTRELKARADQMSAIVDNAMVGISVHDSQGRILSVNPAFRDIFQLEDDRLVGARLCDFIPEIPVEPWTGTIYLDSTTTNGQRLRLRAQVNEWQSKTFERRFIVLFDDVTSEQAVSDELRDANKRLRDGRRQFAEIIDNAPVPLALVDEAGHFTRVNQALARLTGYSRDWLLGNDFQKFIHPGDLKDILRAIERMRSGAADIARVEGRYFHKSGNEMWMLLSFSRARDTVTNEIFFIAQFVDINDRKEIENNNREFFANMSHELRTPLTSIKGAVDLVLATDAAASLSPQADRLLRIAQGNGDRLTKLLNDLLDLEKISSRRIRFRYGIHGIADILDEAVRAATPIAETAGVALETRLDPDLPQLWIDASRLEQVILNLLSNAIKYSDPGRAVLLSVHRREADIAVEVRDFGAGIPDSYRDNVFQPFSQADSSATRRKGGTGLGLSIAKSLIEFMGGRIEFETEEGQGTMFRICLPTGPVSLPFEPTRTFRILHVEPDPAFSDLLARGFGAAAIVETVTSPADAHARLAEGDFDAMIVNWSVMKPGSRTSLDDMRRAHPGLGVIALSDEVSSGLGGLVDLDLSRTGLRLDKIVRKCLRAWSVPAEQQVRV